MNAIDYPNVKGCDYVEKKLDDMSTAELLKEVRNAYKKAGHTPKKFDTAPDGTIILDPNNKNEREWFENDEDYRL